MDGFIPERIRAALSALAGGADFAAAATDLLGELGYRSDRILPGQSGDAGALVRQFPATNPDTQSERDFLREARSVHILFQLTDAEIDAVAQQSLFRTDGLDAGGFDTGNAQSFLFAAVALRGDAYPRSRYAAFTRELNKRFQNPMVVLFRAGAGASGAGTGYAGFCASPAQPQRLNAGCAGQCGADTGNRPGQSAPGAPGHTGGAGAAGAAGMDGRPRRGAQF